MWMALCRKTRQVVASAVGDRSRQDVSTLVRGHSTSLPPRTWRNLLLGGIQGGDPTGTGSGGPGYQFQDEAVKRPYKAGTVAMANAGPNTNGSQFFICLEDQPGLPPNYTIFGDTVAGMDVVRNIRVGDVIQTITVE